MKALLISCLLFLFSPTLSAAEEPTISVKSEVDKATVTIGERIEYRVTITHDPGIKIRSEIPPPPSDPFEVKEVHDFKEMQGKRVVEGRRFLATAYELGEFILDPVNIKYDTPKGDEKTIETNRLYLTVRSVDASGKEKTDIRTVKGVLDLPRDWRWLFAFLFLLLLAGGGGFYGWYWKRRSLADQVGKEPPLTAEDEALLRLNRLVDSDLIRRGKIKEYFLELTDILKFYFERRFEILAIESTTSEIVQDLREKEVAQTLLDKIQQTLDQSDLAKFAKWRPNPVEITRINQTARAVVEEARPKTPVPDLTLSTPQHGI